MLKGYIQHYLLTKGFTENLIKIKTNKQTRVICTQALKIIGFSFGVVFFWRGGIFLTY